MAVEKLLLETGDYLLLETGDGLLLESSTPDTDVLPRGLSSIEWGEVASRGMHNIEAGIVA